MPHKRNPVSSMIALAAATRAPHQAAALLGAMSQQHERGLGNWQAELAEWPGLFLGVHGALRALNDAFAALVIDEARMLRNIDALQGLVFAESASIALAGVIGRPRAHGLLEQLTRKAVTDGAQLVDVLVDAVQADAQLGREIDLTMLRGLFDPVQATRPARRIAEGQLEHLRAMLAR